MSLTECQRTGTFGLASPLAPQPKKSVNFNFDENMMSITDDKVDSSIKNLKKHEQCMPVNFFHSPGVYNKMIIRCAAPEFDSFVERKMGIIKNLQFLNEPLFEKQKEKKYQRVAEYTQKMRKQRGEKSENAGQSCTCCCCDSFCWECAKSSTCEVTSLKEQTFKKEDFLIDIEAVKRGEKPKKKINKPKKTLDIDISNEIEDSHFCCQRKESHRVRIERLINESLLKEIQIQREKELNKLTVKEREKMKEYFNQSVRQFNRTRSAPKVQESKVMVPSKKELRDAYWNSVKDLVSFELKKDKFEAPLFKKQEEEKGIPKRQFRLTAEQMHAKRILNGQEAMRGQKLCKIYQKKLQKMKAKKLMALADEQTEIIKKNRKKKFKPSQKTLQQAFKILQ